MTPQGTPTQIMMDQAIRSKRDRKSLRAPAPLIAFALIFGDHEFQSGPGVIDGANLDIDEAKRKRRIAHDDIREIGGNAGGLLRP
jgi:hypothetical protein